MQKVIATSNLTPKFKWWHWQNPLSFLKPVIEQHPLWEIVDEKKELHFQLIKTTFLVIKNKTGVLDYDPYLMIMLDGTTIYIAPAKDYDSSKEWYDQQGTLNNEGNYIRLGASGGGANNDYLIPKITGIILNDYSLAFSLSAIGKSHGYYSYYYYSNYLKFEIFEPTDTHSSGMIVQNKDDFYIYANSIWYGKDFNNIFNREGKIDIDKPVGTYHKPNAQGSFNATKRTFYINTQTDSQQDPIWQYVGKSYVFYAYADDTYFENSSNYLHFYTAEGILVRTKDNGVEKECFISGLDHQVNESNIIETPHIIEEYNRLQSDFFANPVFQSYYWQLQNSINEVDGRTSSSENNDWYYLYSSDLINSWTVYFTVTRSNNDYNNNKDNVTIFHIHDNRYIYLSTNGGTRLMCYDYCPYYFTNIQISNDFSFSTGDTKTIAISCKKNYMRVFVDGTDVSSGNTICSNNMDMLRLKKAFGSFSDVRLFKTALTDDEIQRLFNNQSVSSSLYTL